MVLDCRTNNGRLKYLFYFLEGNLIKKKTRVGLYLYYKE